MNPEFRRNLWLELTPRRIVLMVVLLALAFFAATVTSCGSRVRLLSRFITRLSSHGARAMRPAAWWARFAIAHGISSGSPRFPRWT
jgi:hypothetical protein